MSRILSTFLFLLWTGLVPAAVSPITPAQLSALDQRSLQATLHGDVRTLEGMLAPGFEAVIQVPTGMGTETRTLRMGRTEFLLYAWQAAALARDYRLTADTPPRLTIGPQGRSATVSRELTERLVWNGQPLVYTSRRLTRYGVGEAGVRITGLEVEVIGWRMP